MTDNVMRGRAKDFTAVRGRRIVMQTQAVVGGLVLQDTPLIRQSFNKGTELLVTVMPPTKGNGITPYVSTFDGLAYPPVGGAIFTAPTLPGTTSSLQILVSWGAGGIRYQTAFDYPALGGTFSITCDTLDVSVRLRGVPPPGAQYTDPNEIPVIGAHYVEGAPVDPTPMAWMEPVLGLAGGADAFWAVKPFAKDVIITVGATGAAVERWGYDWLNTAGAVLASFDRLFQAPGSEIVTLQVPRVATVLRVVNRTAVAKSLNIEWGIGLS